MDEKWLRKIRLDTDSLTKDVSKGAMDNRVGN
jgi:hypothetical protein